MSRSLHRQLLILVCCGCLAAVPVRAGAAERYQGLSDDLSRTLNVLRQEISGEVAKQHATEIWERDRWDSWDKHHETAQYVAEQFRALGLEQVEVIPYKSDGRTKYGDWTSQQAWDVHHARLTVVEPATHAGKIIADYRDIPQTLTTRSGSTPPGGIKVEIVAVHDDERTLKETAADDLRRKLVLVETLGGRAPSAKVISMAKEAGAVGILRDDIPELGKGKVRDRQIGYDAVRWGGSVPNGMIGFNLSPRMGDYLRKLVALHDRVVLHADVETRSYDGTIDVVTGVLPGTESPEYELLVVGHLYEIGANDNASGCGLSIEILRALKTLMGGGRLPPLRRSIRVVLGMETHGTLAWLTSHEEKLPYLIAGIDLDMVGEDQWKTLSTWKQSRLPDSAPSYAENLAWALLQRYVRAADPTMRVATKLDNWYIDDCITADPMVGCPNFLWVQLPDRFYHSSQDTPDKLSANTLHITGTAAGAYLHYLATAQADEALWLATIVEADVQVDLAERTSALIRAAAAGPQTGESLGRAASDGNELITYRLDRGLRALPTVMELVPEKDRKRVSVAVEAAESRLRAQAECQTARFTSAMETMAASREIGPTVPYTRPRFPSAARAKSLIPTRKVIGTLTLVDAPVQIPEGRNWYFTWSWRANTPWWWADGKRDVYEIARRSALEIGREFNEEYLEDVLTQFEFFAQCAYASLKSRD